MCIRAGAGAAGSSAPMAAATPPTVTANADTFPSNPVAGAQAALTSAQSKQELQQAMQTTWNVKVDLASLRNVPTDSLRTALLGIDEVLREFPDMADYLTEVRNKMPGRTGIAGASPDGRIYLRESWWRSKSKVDNQARADARAKWHPANTTSAHYASHEVGHILTEAMIEAAHADVLGTVPHATYINALRNDWRKGTTAKAIVDKAYAAVQAKGHSGTRRDHVGRISGYAKDNDMETIAEAVADCIANKGNARYLSQEIWRILKTDLT